MLHKLFKKLMPKQDEFTVLFVQHAAQAHQAASALRELLAGGDVVRLGAELGRLEREADATAAKIYALLNKSFSTPFRRSEIRALVGAVDSIVDHAEDVAKRMDIYRVGEPGKEMAAMAGKALRCAELICEAVPLLDSVSDGAERIIAICGRIHQAEDEADLIHDAALRALYAQGSAEPADRARALEKVYDLIEEVVDSCEDAANILGDIVAENA